MKGLTEGKNGIGTMIDAARHDQVADRLTRRGEFPPTLRAAGREGLYGKLDELCRRLHAAGEAGVPGSRLADSLHLGSTRLLRRLVAYGRLTYGLHEVVGLPGHGYFWGPAAPHIYASASKAARRMGRDWMFLAAIYGEGNTEANMAQLLLDFASSAEQKAALGVIADGDDLADLVAERRVSVGSLLDHIIGYMRDHREVYGEDLQRVATKHATVLVNASALRSVSDRLAGLQAELRSITLDSSCLQDQADAIPENSG